LFLYMAFQNTHEPIEAEKKVGVCFVQSFIRPASRNASSEPRLPIRSTSTFIPTWALLGGGFTMPWPRPWTMLAKTLPML
jgi:hypothetical protein